MYGWLIRFILKLVSMKKLLPGQNYYKAILLTILCTFLFFYGLGGMKLTTLQLKVHQSAMKRKVNRIWVDLSSFEESSAACISDMLLLVAAGAYMEGFRMASQFAMHLAVLYNALDDIQRQLMHNSKGTSTMNE